MKYMNFFKQSAVVLVIAAVAFAGCDKDDEGGAGSPSPVTKITAKVENGASYNTVVDSVKVSVHVAGSNVVVGSGAYANGGFTIDLPATVDAKYLKAFGNFREGVTVSDPQAMICSASDFIAYKSDVRAGYFEYNNYLHADEEPATHINLGYVYVDRDATFTGFGSESGLESMEGTGGWTENYTYNCSFKKGWNIIYYTWTENSTDKTATSTYTTGAAPKGLKWYYYEPYGNSGSSAKADLIPVHHPINMTIWKQSGK